MLKRLLSFIIILYRIFLSEGYEWSIKQKIIREKT